MKKLEQAGIIQRYQDALDPITLEADHIVFVQVLLSSTTALDLETFNCEVKPFR
jgi:Lrp/AsnC family leucine-responsive transcriptional regulator